MQHIFSHYCILSTSSYLPSIQILIPKYSQVFKFVLPQHTYILLRKRPIQTFFWTFLSMNLNEKGNEMTEVKVVCWWIWWLLQPRQWRLLLRHMIDDVDDDKVEVVMIMIPLRFLPYPRRSDQYRWSCPCRSPSPSKHRLKNKDSNLSFTHKHCILSSDVLGTIPQCTLFCLN